MSRTKKLLAAIFALLLTGSIFNAAAEAETTVNHTVPLSYTVVIPSGSPVVLEYQEESHPLGTITVKDMHVDIGKCIVITVNNADNLALTNEGDGHKLHYTVIDGTGKVFAGRAFTEDGVIDDLSVAISQSEWKSATGGDYSDILTFNVSYEDIK